MTKWSCAKAKIFSKFGIGTWIGALSLFVLAPLYAQGPTHLGRVTPTEFSPNPIAVAPFESQGGEAYSTPLFSDVIDRDLFLSGFFKSIANPQFVLEAHNMDLKDGKIHYEEWQRLKASYIVKGKYKIDKGRLEVEFRMYDVSAGTYIFGKRYEQYKKEDGREVAHRISNDVIQRITGVPGTANTKFVFVGEVAGKKGEAPNKEIFIMDADGQNKRQLTNDHNLAATPAWGANGTEIYYTTYKDYNPDLAGMYLDGSHNWFVSRRAGFNLSPCWSEKKQVITLTLSKDGNSEIYLVNRAGKDLKRLTYSKGIDSSPVWSPSGDQIAFTSDRNGGPQIYIMSEDGVNVSQLTHQGDYNDGAAWSPRGDVIAYSSRIHGIFQICTINVNGTDLRQLTNGNANSEDPCFSPNGWVISYTSDKTGRKHIYTMFVDGRPIQQLTNGDACYSPAWSDYFR